MSNRVLNTLMYRLEESVLNYQIHKNDVWLRQIDSSKEAILKEFERLQIVEKAYEALKKAL